MKADSIIILVLAFSLVTIAIGGIVSDMNNHYDSNASTSWANKYNFATQINQSVSDIQADAEAAGKETGWLSVLSGASAIWRGTTTTIKVILQVPGYSISMIRGISAEMGMPSIVSDVIIPIIILMLMVVIIFIVVRLIRGENV